jgi:hypothetical protein
MDRQYENWRIVLLGISTRQRILASKQAFSHRASVRLAGAIFGARNGMDGLPQDAILRLEQSEYLTKTAMELYQARAKNTQDS